MAGPGFAQQADLQLEAVRKKIDAEKFEEAKADLTKIVNSNPRNKVALNLRGEARIGLLDFYGAISDLTVALGDRLYNE